MENGLGVTLEVVYDVFIEPQLGIQKEPKNSSYEPMDHADSKPGCKDIVWEPCYVTNLP